jgi:acid stress chaperone HdeB
MNGSTTMTLRHASIFALAIAILILAAVQVKAQVTLDVSKITCEQYVGFKITNPKNIGLWLGGYYNGQRGNTIIEPQRFKEILEKVSNYCIQNPKVPVMQAIESIVGKSK